LTWLRNSEENRILTFARREGSEEILVAINTSGLPFVGTIEAAGNFEDVTPNVGAPLLPGQSAPDMTKKANVALPAIALDSWSYRIFRRRN
jgi:hypothetical protein